MIDPTSNEFQLGVVGAGAMGQGIAQVALQGGMNVLLHDARDGGAEAGIDAVLKRLSRLVEKGQITPADRAAMQARIKHVGTLAHLAGCNLIVEAVFEDLALKQGIFAELETHVADDCVLASNTSSLLIASIARACKRPQRVAGLHFFNPVPLMKLVEVIRGPQTSDDVIAFLTECGTRMGRTPVTVKDAPGFLVNFGGRAYTTEAMRILHERVATPAQIDAVMRDCCHFRMGPCELMDLTGVDVNYPVSRIVYKGYDDDPRLKTSFPHKSLLESGQLGRKTGRGNYAYDDHGKIIDAPSPDYTPPAGTVSATSIVLIEPRNGMERFAEELGLNVLKSDDGKSPIVGEPQGEDCTAFAVRTGVDYRRLVAVDLANGMRPRVTIMTAPGADPEPRDQIAQAIISAGSKVTLIKDSPGFIAPRLCAMIANLGCEMAQIGIAEPKQIDLAMRLGLNYPLGPLEIAEEMRLPRLLQILQNMQALTGEDRYRPSMWLRRRAQLGLSIFTPD